MSWSWSFQVPVLPAGVDRLLLLGDALAWLVILVVWLVRAYRGPRNERRLWIRNALLALVVVAEFIGSIWLLH